MHGPENGFPTLPDMLAAVAGAIVGMRNFPGTTYREKGSNLVCGCLIAVFVGPATATYLNITDPRYFAAVVFALGAGGLVLLGAILDGIRQTQFAAIITTWLSKKGT